MCKTITKWFATGGGVPKIRLGLALAAAMALAVTQAAAQNPSDCNANLLGVDIAKNPLGNIVSGTVVTYTVTVQNKSTSGANIGCNVVLGTDGLVFHCPAADGTPTGPTTTLIAGGTTLPADDTILTFNVDCTVTVDPAVTSAQALVDAPGAILDDGFDDPANIDKTISINVVHPCITVTKNCVNDCTPYGDPIQFAGTVMNCGDIALANVTVSDDQAGVVLGPITLAPGQSADYNGEYPTSGDLCGPFTDTVTASGTAATQPDPTTVTATAQATCHVSASPAITLAKDCGTDPFQPDNVKTLSIGDTYSSAFQVQNTGNVPLQNVVVHDTDSKNGPADVPVGTLDIGETKTVYRGPFTVEQPVDPGDCTITDSATVTADSVCPADPPCTTDTTASAGPATCTLTVVTHPDFTVVKTCPPTVTFSVNPQDIPFTVTVKNIGDAAIDLTGTDDNGGLGGTIPLTFVPSHLLPGETATADGVHSVPARYCGPLTDIATVTGTSVCDGAVTHDSNPCTTEIPVNPHITLTKTCGPGPVNAGDPIPFTITVVNDGDVTLTGVIITDTVDNGGPDQIKNDCGDLDPGDTCTFTGSNPTSSPADCDKDVTDTATVNAVDICTQSPVSDSKSCTVHVNPCTPHISVTKQVACYTPSGCGTFADEATGTRNSACPAFCWQITVKNTDPDVSIGSIVIDDPHLGTIDSSVFDPYPILPGETRTYTTPLPDTLCADTVNTVTVTPYTGASATGTAGPSATASATAHVNQIELTCDVALFNSFDMDNNPGVDNGGVITPGDNHVTLPADSVNSPVQVYLTLNNPGTADLIVESVSGLDGVVDCGTGDPVDLAQVLGLPLSIPAGQSSAQILVGCLPVSCPEGASLTVGASANADDHNGTICVYDENGDIIHTEIQSPCTAIVDCKTAVTCRTTGGGDLYNGDENMDCVLTTTVLWPNETDNGIPLDHVSHGGQMGAPFANEDCGQVLGDPCIRGQWQHVRHYVGKGNPRDVYDADFHSATPKGLFDTLECACLPCCSDGVNIPATTAAGKKFALCNPDDHKVCGPQPRPAPANALIWSGMGTLKKFSAVEKGNAAQWVVVRVYIEDRSEPGGFHPKGSVDPADIYSFQVWKTGILVSNNKHDEGYDGNNLPDTGPLGDINVFRKALAADSCAFIGALADGSLEPGSLPMDTINYTDVDGNITDTYVSDVNDQGALRNGNRQIHPSTGATCTAEPVVAVTPQ